MLYFRDRFFVPVYPEIYPSHSLLSCPARVTRKGPLSRSISGKQNLRQAVRKLHVGGCNTGKVEIVTDMLTFFTSKFDINVCFYSLSGE